jgi:hypothetical protein
MIYDLEKIKFQNSKLNLQSEICNLKSQRGVAALLTIVIISAAVLVMSLSASKLGLGELELGYTSQKGTEALSAAEGCMDEALRQMRLNTSYSGDTLNLSNGSCTITVVTSGSDRTITVTGTVGDYNKKIQSNITLSGNVITLNSWIEVSN